MSLKLDDAAHIWQAYKKHNPDVKKAGESIEEPLTQEGEVSGEPTEKPSEKKESQETDAELELLKKKIDYINPKTEDSSAAAETATLKDIPSGRSLIGNYKALLSIVEAFEKDQRQDDLTEEEAKSVLDLGRSLKKIIDVSEELKKDPKYDSLDQEQKNTLQQSISLFKEVYKNKEYYPRVLAFLLEKMSAKQRAKEKEGRIKRHLKLIGRHERLLARLEAKLSKSEKFLPEMFKPGRGERKHLLKKPRKIISHVYIKIDELFNSEDHKDHTSKETIELYGEFKDLVETILHALSFVAYEEKLIDDNDKKQILSQIVESITELEKDLGTIVSDIRKSMGYHSVLHESKGGDKFSAFQYWFNHIPYILEKIKNKQGLDEFLDEDATESSKEQQALANKPQEIPFGVANFITGSIGANGVVKLRNAVAEEKSEEINKIASQGLQEAIMRNGGEKTKEYLAKYVSRFLSFQLEHEAEIIESVEIRGIARGDNSGTDEPKSTQTVGKISKYNIEIGVGLQSNVVEGIGYGGNAKIYFDTEELFLKENTPEGGKVRTTLTERLAKLLKETKGDAGKTAHTLFDFAKKVSEHATGVTVNTLTKKV